MMEAPSVPDWTPLVIAVAPNGARKTKADHPALPMTPGEIADTGRRCADAGASMIHLHVRDDAGEHSLSPDLYREAIAALKDDVGDRLIVQVTSEAVGRYRAEQQMEMVRDLKPQAVSLAIREILPEDADESQVAEFLKWMEGEGIQPQFILYSDEEVRRFETLVERGIVPGKHHFLLFVLGRYSKDLTSSPSDLLPFLESYTIDCSWAVCAFGPRESACAIAAIALGGHARVGFENNLWMPDGRLAEDNASLVRIVADAAFLLNRPLATGANAAKLL